MDQSISQKQEAIDTQDLGAEETRKLKAASFEEEVKVSITLCHSSFSDTHVYEAESNTQRADCREDCPTAVIRRWVSKGPSCDQNS